MYRWQRGQGCGNRENCRLSPSARVIEPPFGIAAGAFSTGVHKSAAESRVSVTPNALNYIVIPQQEHTGYAKLLHFYFLMRDDNSYFPLVGCIIHDSLVKYCRPR